MIGKELTDEALQTINHDRQDSYGKPEDSFGSIARRWTEFLHNRFGTASMCSDIEFSSSDVAFMMMELKMARENNKHKRDNLVDLVGYTALVDMLEGDK